MKRMGLVENEQGRFYFKRPSVGDRFDAGAWSAGLFGDDVQEISKKVGLVISNIKGKEVVK